MKKRAIKIFNQIIVIFLIIQVTSFGISAISEVSGQTISSKAVISEDLVIDITQNASSLGVHSQIDFNIDLLNNGSYLMQNLNVNLVTSASNVEILPTQTISIANLGEMTKHSFEVSIKAIGTDMTQSVDLVLIVDASGSMGEEISSVQEELTNLINVMSAGVPDLRIGAIFHGSTKYSEYPMSSPHNYLDLTSEFGQIKDLINSFSASGGKEPWGDALYLANTFNWRSGSQKLIILVGDEDCDPGHIVGDGWNESWYNGSELLDVVTQLKENGVIISTVVCENPDNYVEHQFRWISKFTEGKTVFLPELQNGEVPITLPEVIQEWTLEISREYSNWLIVDVEWQDMDSQMFSNSAEAHYWLDFSYPSLVYYEKIVPTGSDVLDVHFYAEVVDFSAIAHVALYYNVYEPESRFYIQSSNRGGGLRGAWIVNQMEFDNVTSLYFTAITGLPRGYNLSFFFETADILNNAGVTPYHWILVDHQTKQWGEKSIVPISQGESICSLIEFKTDEPAFLLMSGSFTISDISVLITNEQDIELLHYSDNTMFESDPVESYRILEYSMVEGTYFLNLTIPTSSENQLTTIEYTWIQANSFSNNTTSVMMDEKVRVHLYSVSVEEDTNIVIDYTPESDLVVKGSVYHMNWTFIGDFSVLEAVSLAPGSYYALIEGERRVGTYRLILTDEVPNITDRYYGGSASPGFEMIFSILSLISLGFIFKFKKQKMITRNTN